MIDHHGRWWDAHQRPAQAVAASGQLVLARRGEPGQQHPCRVLGRRRSGVDGARATPPATRLLEEGDPLPRGAALLADWHPQLIMHASNGRVMALLLFVLSDLKRVVLA